MGKGNGNGKNGNGGKHDGEQRSLVQQGPNEMLRREDDDTDVQVLDIGAISAMASAEIDRQIATAHQYPRMLSACQRRMYELATMDRATAESCHYILPKKDQNGNLIEGPSVRFAEIVASAWGNIRYGAEVIDRQREFIVARGFCHDLETNVAVSITVRRRCVDKHGRRYSDDVMQSTENAGCSIALRNAIFRVVPKAATLTAYNAAMKLADGEGKTMPELQAEAIGWYIGLGAKAEQVVAALGKQGQADITLADIRYLRGLYNAIKQEGLSLERALQPQAERDAEKRGPATTAPSDLLEGETGAQS